MDLETILGKKTAYIDFYDNSLLQPISRKFAREQLQIVDALPFYGFDIWNCYEVSWLSQTGAYVSEIIRAGINAVDKGQIEAAKVLGIPERLMFKDIILPQAIRNILPSLVNELINLIKESSIISMIGAVFFTKLQIRDTPDISSPVITVYADYPRADALYMEKEITTRIEKVLKTIKNLDSITSQSATGSSYIVLTFLSSANIEASLNEVRSKIAEISYIFPKDMQAPYIGKQDANNFPSLFLSISSDVYNNLQLTQIVQENIVSLLEKLETVGRVEVHGGKYYSMRIEPDPVKLYQHKMSVLEIENAIKKQNIYYPAGTIKTPTRDFTVRLDGSLSKPEQFEQIILKVKDASILRLQDIAKVYLAPPENNTIVRYNNKSALILGLMKQSKANLLDLSKEVRYSLDKIKKNLPKGVTIDIAYDTSIPVNSSIKSVFFTIFEALILVIIVVYLFLASVRITLIPFVTIPVSLIAMILAIGLVVDDAIVMMENIFRYNEMGHSSMESAILASKEIGFAIIAMTITLASVFLPIGFIDGFIGKLFIEFAWTLAFCVLVSGFVALTLTPMMASRMIGKNDQPPLGFLVKFDQFIKLFQSKYLAYLNLAFDHKKQFSLIIALSLVVLVVSFIFVPKVFIPQEDDGIVELSFFGSQGSNSEQSEKSIVEVEKILSSYKDIADWKVRSMSQKTIKNLLNQQFQKIAGISIFAMDHHSPISGNAGHAVEFTLQSSLEYEQLAQISEKFVKSMGKNPIFMNIHSDLDSSMPTIDVIVNRDKAYLYDVSLENIGLTLQYLLAGKQIGDFRMGNELYDITMQYNLKHRSNIAHFSKILIPTNKPTNNLLPLNVVANIVEKVSIKYYNHYNNARSVTISADLAPNQKITDAIKQVNNIANELLDNNTTILEYIGEIKRKAESEAQFESFTDPILILIAVPFSFTGGVLTLWIFGNTINIYSSIGLLTLVGLITKNSIMIVEFTNNLRSQGLNIREAVTKASDLRLRPILMTTLATIFGAVSLVIASGAGAEAQKSIGLVIVGESVIRGEKSCGMLCSEEELLLGTNSEGIIELLQDAKIGESLIQYYGYGDPVFDINVTPNRGDALGVYGIARDLAASGIGTLKELEIGEIRPLAGKFKSTLTLQVENKEACPLFSFREIRNLQNKPSPDWLKQLLQNIGVKPVSAIVDVTNYISYSFGQPMHAYDRNKLLDNIQITTLKEKTKFVALNGKEYDLDAGDLVVQDDRQVLALAGIIGGDSSSCGVETQNILLEAACFSAKYITKTGRCLQIDTDSRYRFERNIDQEFTLKALNIASKMIFAICGGEISDIVYNGQFALAPRTLDFPVNCLAKITGLNLSKTEICDILKKLGFIRPLAKLAYAQGFEGDAERRTAAYSSVREDSSTVSTYKLPAEVEFSKRSIIVDIGDTLKLTIPSWRHDIAIKEDIVEEIVRIYGYDKLEPIKLYSNDLKNWNIKQGVSERSVVDLREHANTPQFCVANSSKQKSIPEMQLTRIIPKEQRRISDIKRILASCGYDEVVTNSFMDSETAKLFAPIKEELFLLNPINIDNNYMRPSIIAKLLKLVQKNLARSIKEIALMELGPIFNSCASDGELIFASAIRCGQYNEKDCHSAARPVDVFDIKSDLENVLNYAGLPIDKCQFAPIDLPYYHPTNSNLIKLGKNVIAYFGQIHPSILKNFDIDCQIFAFEINIANIPFAKAKFAKRDEFIVSDFQPTFRDYAFIVDLEQPVGKIIAYIKNSNKKTIKSVELFDIYSGDKLPSGKKSVAIKVQFQADDRTLNETDLNLLSQEVIATAYEKFQGLLDGKKGLITGIANNLSISWAIAQMTKEHGADLAFTYQGEVLEKRVMPLAEQIGCNFVVPCDVTSEESLDNVFKTIEQKWGKLDFLVHSIAFSDRNELKVAMAKRAEPLMKDGGSILTLTYYGSQKVVRNYNVMGPAKAALESSVKYLATDMGSNNIRVNALSAGPMKTLASSGINDFKTMLASHEATSPLRRNISPGDVAGSALYLLSSLASGVTGEIHYVDCGFNTTVGTVLVES
ncbi:Phenylalanine--tRNA ligase beta subunit [Pseudolycoriella hygida]|uniref:phenylalanine--tRNA ligase n=1 Tax=Pseudolycoriella hygida TaxID=35572 RepID=A0A9Q0N871_9DIPT|nr:Phenylalanine--tRNA ligase beta subunit [Pseudolycoriella hygida]